MDYAGRDTIDEAGARIYHLEFYNVIIVRELTKEASLNMERGFNIGKKRLVVEAAKIIQEEMK